MTPLLEVVDILMKPGGTMVLSDPGRPMIRTFIEKMEAKGFSVSETQVNVPFREVLTRVFIFEIRQK